jgi:hypothetical protein
MGLVQEPVILYENTGVTFAANRIVQPIDRLGQKLVRKQRPVVVYLLMPLVGLIGAAIMEGSKLAGAGGAVAAIAIMSLLLLWPIPMVRAWRKNRAGSKLGRVLSSLLSSCQPLTALQLAEILQALSHPRLTREDREYQCRQAYLGLILTLVADRRVTSEELQLLDKVEETFQLPPEFIIDARTDAFRDAYLEAMSDEQLTEEEEQSLDNIREGLNIPASALKPELEAIQNLREIRLIRQGAIPIIDSSHPLQKNEICHYEAPARILKEKTLKSFQRDGQKHKVRGLTIDKEGKLIITSKRIVLVHEGITTIPLNRVVDLEIDYDKNVLTITKDSAQSPVLLTTPDALRSGAILAAVVGL